jgi:hypothetical protein
MYRCSKEKIEPIIEAFSAATWSLFMPAPELVGTIFVYFIINGFIDWFIATSVTLLLRWENVQLM